METMVCQNIQTGKTEVKDVYPFLNPIKRAKTWTKTNNKRKPQIAQYYRQNRNECLSYQKEYQKHNRQKRNQYIKNKRANDVIFDLVVRCRNRLGIALKNASIKKTKRTMEFIGCSGAKLKSYVESLFLPGMSWENRAEWHLDHKIPIASFDLTNPDELKKCFHYTNLQPLWAKDNMTKKCKIQ